MRDYLEKAVGAPPTAQRAMLDPDPALDVDRLIYLLPEAFYVCDRDGLILRYNRVAAELWGRRPRIGDPADRFCGSYRMYCPDGVPMPHAACPMADVLRSGIAVRNGEVVIERPDGSRIVALVNIDPLRNAAGDIVGAANCFRDVTEHRRLQEQQRQTEKRSHKLLQLLPAAIYTTDAAGRITFYNEAAAKLWGCRPELGESEFCGSWKLYRPDGSPLPHDQCPMALALKEKRPIRGVEAVAERPDGTRVPFIPYPTPLFDPAGRLTGAVNMLIDISDRRAAEDRLLAQARRLEALDRIAKAIASDLSLDKIVQTVTDAATELSGARFGAFFHNLVDGQGERYMLYSLSGAPREAFGKFGMPRSTAVFETTFRGLGTIRSDDIRTDPRYGRSPPHNGMPKGHLPVVSYLAVPVTSRSGEVHGGLFFGHEQPGVFTSESQAIVESIAAHAAIAMDNARLLRQAEAEIDERRLAQERLRLLLREMSHRVKNAFALAGSVVALSARSARDPAEISATVGRRLGALARAHELILPDDGDGHGKAGSPTTLDTLVRTILAPYESADEPGRFAIRGGEVPVGGKVVSSLALLIQEFATNAAKYGALSTPDGRVEIAWSDSADDLVLTWSEHGTAPLEGPPDNEGFGSLLARAAVTGQLQGQFAREWRPDGLHIRLSLPRQHLTQ